MFLLKFNLPALYQSTALCCRKKHHGIRLLDWWDSVVLGRRCRPLSMKETFLICKIYCLKSCKNKMGQQNCSIRKKCTSDFMFSTHTRALRLKNKRPTTITSSLLKYVRHVLSLSLFRKSNLLSNEINVFEKWVSFCSSRTSQELASSPRKTHLEKVLHLISSPSSPSSSSGVRGWKG